MNPKPIRKPDPRRNPALANEAYIGRIQRLIEAVSKRIAFEYNLSEGVVQHCAEFPMRKSPLQPVRYRQATATYDVFNLIRQGASLSDSVFDLMDFTEERPSNYEIRKLAIHFKITDPTARRLWNFVKKIRAHIKAHTA